MFTKINTTIFNDQLTFAKVLRNDVFTLDTCFGISDVAYMQVRFISMVLLHHERLNWSPNLRPLNKRNSFERTTTQNDLTTRMHSSRMHTARSSSRRGWVAASVHAGIHPPPLKMWAWRLPRGCGSRDPSGCGHGDLPRSRPPPQEQTPPCGQTDTCKNITFGASQTSFAGGKYNDFTVASTCCVGPEEDLYGMCVTAYVYVCLC